MRYILISAAMLVGTAASAQDLRYSDDATVDCINGAESLPEQRACVGASAKACMNATPGGQKTYGMGGCLDRELSFWDEILNINYQTARKRAKAVDVKMKDLGTSLPSLDQSLRDMQRAWIPFRDATCDYERGQWGGGTGGGPATLWCLLRLTGEQALYLNDAWIGE